MSQRSESGYSPRRRDPHQLITAIDRFCAQGLAHTFGNRVTVRREAFGDSVAWAFCLDGIELCRVAVTRLPPGGYGYSTSNAVAGRGGPSHEQELVRVILTLLERQVELDLGERAPGAFLYSVPILESTEPRERLGATDVSGPTCVEGQESSNRARRGGARRLERREDWAHKRETAQRWVQAWKSGRTTQEAAAHQEGHHVDTLRNWARRAGFMD